MALISSFGLLLPILVVPIPLFIHLDVISMQKQDEVRLATSALEISQNQDLLKNICHISL